MRKLKEWIRDYFEWAAEQETVMEGALRYTPLLAFIFLVIVLLIVLSHFF